MTTALNQKILPKDKEAKRKIKKLKITLSHRHKKLLSDRKKIIARQVKEAKRGIHGAISLTQKDSAINVLQKLHNFIGEMAVFNKIDELNKLNGFFVNRDFHWTCGFGHSIQGGPIKSLRQLKQIIARQKGKKFCQCEFGHKAVLLLSEGNLLAISVEDLSHNEIHGGKFKD